MKRLIMSILLTALLYQPSGGAEIVILSYDAAPGTYYVEVVVDADGKATVRELEADYHLGDGFVPRPTPDDPVEPDPPPTDPLSELSKAVKSAADSVTGDPNREATAAKLATLYEETGAKLAAGEVEGMTAWEVIRELTDLILVDNPGTWSTWRKQTSDALARAQQSGATYQTLIDDVAAGLRASSGRSDLDIGTVIKLVQIVVDARRRGEVLTLETLLAIVAALGGL